MQQLYDIHEYDPDQQQMEQSASVENRIWSVWHVVSSVLLAVAVGFCLIISVQIATNGYVRIAGFSMFRVVTGSMEPTISVGEAILCKRTEIASIQEGDIICYLTQLQEIRGSVVTHRVVGIRTGKNGEICLETRGDANLATDPYVVTASNLVGCVVWRSGEESLFTDILSFLTGKIGFLTCIVFPVLLAAGMIMQSSVKSLYRELQAARRELEKLDGSLNEETLDVPPTAIPEKQQPLPGYTYLTQEDYDALWETLRAELTKELQTHVTETTKQPTDTNANIGNGDC